MAWLFENINVFHPCGKIFKAHKNSQPDTAAKTAALSGTTILVSRLRFEVSPEIQTRWRLLEIFWILLCWPITAKLIIKKKTASASLALVEKKTRDETAKMNSTCCESEELSMAAKIVLSTWYGIASLATIVGNAVVLWLISKNRSLRTISNLFLTSLAAADFLVGLVIDPVHLLFRCLLFKTDTYLKTYSKTIDYLWIHTTVATAFNLCCVTLDRHVAIFYSLRYEEILTYTRCYVLIATVWFMSLVLPCSRFLVEDVIGLPALYISFTIITVLIPMIIIILCSIRILKAASLQSRRITVSTVQNQDAVKTRKKNFKAAKTISIVVGLFVVCWLPSLVTSFVHYLGKRLNFYAVWRPVEAVALTSSAVNPWVYCLRNAEFYQALTGTFRFLRRRNSAQNGIRRSIKK